MNLDQLPRILAQDPNALQTVTPKAADTDAAQDAPPEADEVGSKRPRRSSQRLKGNKTPQSGEVESSGASKRLKASKPPPNRGRSSKKLSSNAQRTTRSRSTRGTNRASPVEVDDDNGPGIQAWDANRCLEMSRQHVNDANHAVIPMSGGHAPSPFDVEDFVPPPVWAEVEHDRGQTRDGYMRMSNAARTAYAEYMAIVQASIALANEECEEKQMV